MPDDEPFGNLNVPEDPLADVDRATKQLPVQSEKRRYAKKPVITDGFEGDIKLESLVSELASGLGTDCTGNKGDIELQGDHEERIRELLRS